MKLKSLLTWRYATKRMTGKKVPAEKINEILDNIRLSASSIGLQPYNILVIEDKELREKIKIVANNQAQITEASHLLVFAAWANVTEAQTNAYIKHMAEVRHVAEESLATMKNYLTSITKNTPEQNFTWAARQAYIALGTALIAAAEQGVDATPMEGFNAEALDELLELDKKGLRSLALLPLGYRDTETDWLVNLPKVRTEKEQLFITYIEKDLAETV